MAWQFLAQAAAAVAGHIFGNRSRKDAEDEARQRSEEYYNRSQASGRRTERRTNRAVDKLADRFERSLDKQTAKYQKQAAVSAANSLSVSQAAATTERRQVEMDEASRFVRLRQAAEAGGFNPLTVLEAGFTGASLPTGVLSPDFHLGQQGLRQDVLATGYSTKMNLKGSSASVRVDGRLQATAMGQNQASLTYDALQRGNELAVQAGASAYDRTSSFFNNVGNLAASHLDYQATKTQLAQGQAGLDLDRERLELDRSQFSYEREYNARMASLASAGGRLPGAGGVRVASSSGPTLSPGTGGHVTINGRDYPGAHNISNEETVSAAVGGLWGEVVTAVANITEADAMLNELVWYQPARDIAQGFTDRSHNAGRAWGAISDGLRSAWSQAGQYQATDGSQPQDWYSDFANR